MAISILLVCVSIGVGQVLPENIYPGQTYYEDSGHVFWTWYPNPFSPPAVGDTGNGQIQGALTFCCDLSDSVDLAFVAENDSIVYHSMLVSRKPPHFSVVYWMAGPKVTSESLPYKSYTGDSDQQLKLLLSVKGRPKSVRPSGIYAPRGWHLWIDEGKSDKR